jgi:hypothetical protein
VIVHADGAYLLGLIPAGTYDLAATMNGYLRKVNKNIVVSAGGTTSGIDFSLKPGDLNNTNSVNILDLNLIKQNYGKSGEK